jgi:hypothetical protein
MGGIGWTGRLSCQRRRAGDLLYYEAEGAADWGAGTRRAV